MVFEISELEVKSFDELRTLFATLPKTCISIVFQGDFRSDSENIVEALAYLPRTVGSITFRLGYVYDKIYYTVAIENSNDTRSAQTLRKGIGKGLRNYIVHLPPSIENLRFDFIDRQDIAYGQIRVCTDFAELVKVLPPHVRQLNLDNATFYKEALFLEYLAPKLNGFGREDASNASQLFKNIPATVNSLAVGKLRLGRLLAAKRETIVSAINPGTTVLSLANNELYRLDTLEAIQFFGKLPPNIISLNLGYNGLNQKTAAQLALFLSAIKMPALKQLRLIGNELSSFTPQDLIQALSGLQNNIEFLDLSGNNLLRLDLDLFEQLMNGLPQTIHTLRLCERAAISKEELASRFFFIPPHIKTVVFSHSNLLGLSVEDFLYVLEPLPKTVEGIYLTASRLSSKTVKELVSLLSKLPKHLHRLKLNENNLNCLELSDLKEILSKLSPQIRELDICSNGFNRLPAAKLHEVLRAIPPTVKILTSWQNEFRLRNDGVLVPSQEGQLKPEKRFINQQGFAKLRIIVMQMLPLMSKSGLPTELIFKIFSEVFKHATRPELEQMIQAYSQLIISSVPPEDIQAEHEKECLTLVEGRIKSLKPDETCLDLSRCGLNRLVSDENQKIFINSLIEIPQPLSHLKLRGNGFLSNDKSRLAFSKLIKGVPAIIGCLDLSDNGLEHLDAEALAEHFAFLPITIKGVILDHEGPLSPALQVAKRVWPASYYQLTAGTQNKSEQAFVLLNDYIKGDSALWRFLTLHWNRHNIDKVVQLVYQLVIGAIEPEILIEELAQIKTDNPVGSLVRRSTFLAYHQPKPNVVIRDEGREISDAVATQQQGRIRGC